VPEVMPALVLTEAGARGLVGRGSLPALQAGEGGATPPASTNSKPHAAG